MTVRELMDELQEQDPDARVLTVCPDADTAYERAIDRVVSGDDEDAVLSRCGMYRRYFEENDGKSVYLRSSQVWAKREWSARY